MRSWHLWYYLHFNAIIVSSPPPLLFKDIRETAEPVHGHAGNLLLIYAETVLCGSIQATFLFRNTGVCINTGLSFHTERGSGGYSLHKESALGSVHWLHLWLTQKVPACNAGSESHRCINSQKGCINVKHYRGYKMILKYCKRLSRLRKVFGNWQALSENISPKCWSIRSVTYLETSCDGSSHDQVRLLRIQLTHNVRKNTMQQSCVYTV